MEDYRSNSHKAKAEAKEAAEKKVNKVVTGNVKRKKKSEVSKFKDVFISEDVSNVKTYIFLDVLVPAIKKAVSDIVKDGIDMMLYGDKRSSSRGSSSYVSYRSYSDNTSRNSRRLVRASYDFDDVVFDTRGEADEVLSSMDELMDTYGVVSVADMYDLCGMSLNLSTRLAHAWNAFTSRDPTQYIITGPGYSSRPDRPRLSRGNEKSIATSIFNRIALDVSSVNIKHCRLDKNGRYVEDIDSGLNNCLNLEANKDQTGRAFIQDVVLSMLDEGCVALVPVETTIDPKSSNSYQIDSMRTGKITEWYPDMVRVRLYNDRTGEKEEILLPKNQVAIIENPLYAVVNEYNSTMQRLIRKLSLLDVTDEQTASGKLDLIIQLPYVIKTEARREQVERRRKDIINQLAGSQYGIAYTDGTEKIIQLNRSLENNLLKQVEYLTNMVYSQLGITQSVLDGTADEKTMLNYMNRTVEPIISAIVDELKRKFLTKTARSQLQSIVYFRDPFRLVPVNDIAEIADKFTRNEIMTSNEIRQIVGMQPSKDPKADKLVNSNISQAKQDMSQTSSATEAYEEGGYSQNG